MRLSSSMVRGRAGVLGALLWAGTLAACGAKGGPVALLTLHTDPSQQTVADTPWPSDLFMDASGHLAIAKLPTMTVDVTPKLLDDLHRTDGFGTTTGASFPISEAIDPATLAGHVHLYDLETLEELDSTAILRTGDKPPRIYARAANGNALLEHHRYAWILSRKITGKTGALRPSDDMTHLLLAPTGSLLDLVNALDASKLTEDGVPLRREDVALATTFVTQSITAELTAARTHLAPTALTITKVYAFEQGTADGTLDGLLGTPAVQQPGRDNPGGIAHAHIGFVVHGTFSSPDFLGSGAVTAAGGSASAVNELDVSSGAPVPRGMATVPFTLVLPLPTANTYAAQKIAIFQHGLGDDRSAVMAVAEGLAARGIATIGIDIPFHGARCPGAVDEKHSYGTTAGPDGWPEAGSAPSLLFFNVNGNPAAGIVGLQPSGIRAAFQQAVVDIMQEVTIVRDGDWAPLKTREPRLATLAFDRAHVVYSGESFGGMMGGMTLAMEPGITGGVLDVAGGGLLFPLLLNSANEGPTFGVLLPGGLGTDPKDDPPETDFAFNLAQMLLERGDPLAYAPYIIRHPLAGAPPKHVLQLSAYLDETVPNQSNEALARAIGLEPVAIPNDGASPHLDFWPNAPTTKQAPVMGNVMGVTAGFVQMETASHVMISWLAGGREYDLTQPFPYPKLGTPQSFTNPVARVQSIYGAFVEQLVAGAVPAVTAGQ